MLCARSAGWSLTVIFVVTIAIFNPGQPMAPFTSLSSSKANEKLLRLFELYGTHRPVVQRILNVSFGIYVLVATYTSIVGGSGREGKSRSKKNKKNIGKGKPDRVAVRSDRSLNFKIC